MRCASSSTRSRSSSESNSGRLNAFDAVPTETPARSATSLRVGFVGFPPCRSHSQSALGILRFVLNRFRYTCARPLETIQKEAEMTYVPIAALFARDAVEEQLDGGRPAGQRAATS